MGKRDQQRRRGRHNALPLSATVGKASKKAGDGPSNYFKLRQRAQQERERSKAHAIVDSQATAGGDTDMAVEGGDGADDDAEEEHRRTSATLADINRSLLGLGREPSSSTAPLQPDEAADPSPSSLVARAERAAAEPALSGRKDNSARAYMREVRKVVELADVLLEVLDVRDPLGCRSPATERLALAAGKRVVLILNKIDLVPRANVEGWLRYLRHELPTLAFKASTQQQRSHLSQGRAAVPTAKPHNGTLRGGSATATAAEAFPQASVASGSEALGANALLQLLKNYARSAPRGSSSRLKSSLNVGVIGAPNVGKSSLINSLKRSRACGVAPVPGHTKVVQSVALDRHVRLLDCPGVVLASAADDRDARHAAGADADGEGVQEDEEREAWQVLRNTVKVELIEDPIRPVRALLRRADADQLTELYGITGGFDRDDVQDFLLRLALVRGRLAKGGRPDLEAAARLVLHDWNVGKVRYWSEVPAVHRSMLDGAKGLPAAPRLVDVANEHTPRGVVGADAQRSSAAAANVVAGASIVAEFGEAFDLAALLGAADAEALGAGDGRATEPLPQPPLSSSSRRTSDRGARDGIQVDEEEEARVEEDGVAAPEVPRLAGAAGAAAARTSLGKRQRGTAGLDEELEEEVASSSDEEGAARYGERGVRLGSRRLPLRGRPSSSSDPDDDDNNDGMSGSSVPASAEPEWLQRQRARAAASGGLPATSAPSSKLRQELGQLFGAAELRSMAPRDGEARRRAKKAKKRARRAAAGAQGLAEFVELGMTLGEEGGDREGDGDGEEGEELSGDGDGVADALGGTGGDRPNDVPAEGDARGGTKRTASATQLRSVQPARFAALETEGLSGREEDEEEEEEL